MNLTEQFENDLNVFVMKTEALNEIVETDPNSVQHKQQTYESIRQDSEWNKDWTAANIWTGAFFYTSHR